MELSLAGIIIRISIMYLYALLLIRISGKQSVSHLSAMDFVVITIIGDLFDDIFWAEVPILKGMIGFGLVMLTHMLVCYVASRNLSFFHLVSPQPTSFIQKGKLLTESLEREWTRRETVQFELRLKGEEHLKEVKEARWEPKGQISVIKTKDSETVKKKDIELLR